MKLSELAVGASAVVREFPRAGAVFLRLREMGLVTGTRVTLVRTAPLGDPLELKVRGYHLLAIVKATSPYQKLADLKDKKVAQTSPSSMLRLPQIENGTSMQVPQSAQS